MDVDVAVVECWMWFQFGGGCEVWLEVRKSGRGGGRLPKSWLDTRVKNCTLVVFFVCSVL